MPKLAIPLTDEQIAGLAPRDRPYKISDGHGLYLLVEPTGKKRWRMDFRLHGRRKPATRTFHLSMNDQGGMVIENRSHRLALTAQQVAALRAFLIATGDDLRGE